MPINSSAVRIESHYLGSPAANFRICIKADAVPDHTAALDKVCRFMNDIPALEGFAIEGWRPSYYLLENNEIVLRFEKSRGRRVPPSGTILPLVPWLLDIIRAHRLEQVARATEQEQAQRMAVRTGCVNDMTNKRAALLVNAIRARVMSDPHVRDLLTQATEQARRVAEHEAACALATTELRTVDGEAIQVEPSVTSFARDQSRAYGLDSELPTMQAEAAAQVRALLQNLPEKVYRVTGGTMMFG